MVLLTAAPVDGETGLEGKGTGRLSALGQGTAEPEPPGHQAASPTVPKAWPGLAHWAHIPTGLGSGCWKPEAAPWAELAFPGAGRAGPFC